jgi:hypothetical protein
MKEIMRPLVFSTWLASLKMMFSSSIHLPVNDKISFFVAELNSIIYKYHIFLIDSSVLGHLGCFHSLAIVNKCHNKHECAGSFIVT